MSMAISGVIGKNIKLAISISMASSEQPDVLKTEELVLAIFKIINLCLRLF